MYKDESIFQVYYGKENRKKNFETKRIKQRQKKHFYGLLTPLLLSPAGSATMDHYHVTHLAFLLTQE